MWRYYTMRANSSMHTFYAPDLDEAFTQARGRWPRAKEWECLGSTVEAPTDG